MNNERFLNLWGQFNAWGQLIFAIISVTTQAIHAHIIFIFIMHLLLFIKDLFNIKRQLPNAVTFLRLLLLFVFFKTNNGLQITAYVIVIFFILDGMDGIIARYLKVDNYFGEVIDKELDAAFILLLSLIITIYFDLKYFIIVGILRYLYVIMINQIKKFKISSLNLDSQKKIFKYFFAASMFFLFMGFYLEDEAQSIIFWNVSFIFTGVSFFMSFREVLFKK